jgi:hypothetical protein
MPTSAPFARGSVSGLTFVPTTTSTTQPLGANAQSVYVTNVGSGEAFINFGSSSVTATAGTTATSTAGGDISIPGGFYGVFAAQNQSWVAGIIAPGSTSATLRLMTGSGE